MYNTAWLFRLHFFVAGSFLFTLLYIVVEKHWKTRVRSNIIIIIKYTRKQPAANRPYCLAWHSSNAAFNSKTYLLDLSHFVTIFTCKMSVNRFSLPSASLSWSSSSASLASFKGQKGGERHSKCTRDMPTLWWWPQNDFAILWITVSFINHSSKHKASKITKHLMLTHLFAPQKCNVFKATPVFVSFLIVEGCEGFP